MTEPVEFDSDTLSVVADVSDFLTANQDELIETFKPSVLQFLSNEHLFTGVFRIAFDSAFDEFVSSLIRNELIENFPHLNPEQILMLTDSGTISLISTDAFFYPEVYREEM